MGLGYGQIPQAKRDPLTAAFVMKAPRRRANMIGDLSCTRVQLMAELRDERRLETRSISLPLHRQTDTQNTYTQTPRTFPRIIFYVSLKVSRFAASGVGMWLGPSRVICISIDLAVRPTDQL